MSVCGCVVVQANPEEFRKDLINIAKTTLSSKLLNQEKDHFGNRHTPTLTHSHNPSRQCHTSDTSGLGVGVAGGRHEPLRLRQDYMHVELSQEMGG